MEGAEDPKIENHRDIQNVLHMTREASLLFTMEWFNALTKFRYLALSPTKQRSPLAMDQSGTGALAASRDGIEDTSTVL